MTRRFAPLLAAFLLALPMTSGAEMMTDQFEDTPEARWDLVTDGVMGGVSTGEAAFIAEEGRVHARMTGEVSTANNGGFIQIRRELPDAAPEEATGVRLVVRGNDQRYFVHLRTSGTLLPWQYYQAGFAAEGDWTEIRLPFEAFERSGALLRKVPRAESLRSLGIVAFGRDHAAEIEVREIGFY